MNAIYNQLKGMFVCSWKGHDVVGTTCFMCWKWDKSWGEDN